jgi:hypothetical protein
VHFADAPQSLKQLSRLAVRRSIRAQNLARYVPALPLPDALKQYLLFSEEKLGDFEDASDVYLSDHQSSEDDELDDSDDDSDDSAGSGCAVF